MHRMMDICFALILLFAIAKSTDEPLVGILTLPCSDEPYQCAANTKATSYLPASYVKWLEGGGARVVPLIADDSFTNINQLLAQLNGVLITGGAAGDTASSFWWNQLNNILDNLRKFRDDTLSKQAIPLWATCLGFEGVQQITAGTISVKISRVSVDKSLPIQFTTAAATSRIFNSFMDKNDAASVYNKLSSENLTYNHHNYGISPTAYNGSFPWLSSNFSVLGTNIDQNGDSFVSLIETFESTALYWYGSQFHPEKPQYIFDADGGNNNIEHSLDAIMVMQYFVEFFVNECRLRNANVMIPNEYDRNVIYNFQPHFVDNGSRVYEQVYLFEKP